MSLSMFKEMNLLLTKVNWKPSASVLMTQQPKLPLLGKAFTSMEAVKNPNSPKIVVDNQGFAMYFSRSIIPYVRGKEEEEWLKSFPYLKHLGIYAYRKEVLKEVTKLPQSSLEIAESLEQLRWLQNGYKIKSWYYRCRNCRHRHARRFAAGRRLFEKQKVIKNIIYF